MAASRQDLRAWFLSGKAKGATHMIVVCDTFDWEDFPVFVMPAQDVHEIARQYSGPGSACKIMEVYKMDLSVEYQMSEHRAFHY